ncbi:type II and III secretion system protein [Nostoc sp. CHAB 5715]|uniref:type II and III secretion system protein n=1 Tax=Nostoc sp. CHAB 5715 TaxID=2780400 RepID=UPI001E59E184|nr:type II and III secretion system protein [Nostoc sp. CHAB 5715]MCC5626066.1 type II and III secretion system protein [Nostoc sp. CHAB 5715]
MYNRQLSFLLSLGAIAVLGGNLSAQAQKPTIFPNKTMPMAENRKGRGSQRIKLYYFRNTDALNALLNDVNKSAKWGLTISTSTDNEIILYGSREARNSAYRLIAGIDLPRPGIKMEMWGIQISSNNPKNLAKVMSEVRQEINQTQQLVQETYAQIEQYAKGNIQENDFDPEFKKLVERLGYKSALNKNRPLSLTDIVLRLVAAETKNNDKTKEIANKLTQFVQKDDRYKYYLDKLREQGRQPLERFFSIRGLNPKCRGEKETKNAYHDCWKTGFEDDYAHISRATVLDFALQYAHFIDKPDQFSPYDLQQSADVFNNRLQDIVDALNQDIEDFFVIPTLIKIQEIVSEFKDVEYAQVGRTSVSSLSGIKTVVNSDSISAFDVTPPLKLSDLLRNADNLTEQVDKFVPAIPSSMSADPIKPSVGSLPLAQVIGLVAALQEQNAVFRELKTGVSLTVTPNVLRNMNSAELKIDLTIVDPLVTGTEQNRSQEPLSRIGKQEVTTNVYTKAVDFFALSTFSNQSTLNGGRAYVPIIGTVWKGIFGDVPVLGDLFSWKKGPKKVLHESLLLTNSFISPTAMGMGLLYPLDSNTPIDDQKFHNFKCQVEKYRNNPDTNNRVFEKSCL